MKFEDAIEFVKKHKLHIGILGKSGTGKTTLAEKLESHLKFTHLQFSKPLRKLVLQAILSMFSFLLSNPNFSKDPVDYIKKKFPDIYRNIMTNIGDLMHAEAPNFLLNNVIGELHDTQQAIFSDVRRIEELGFLTRGNNGAESITVSLVNTPFNSPLTKEQKAHATECDLDDIRKDQDIMVDVKKKDVIFREENPSELTLALGAVIKGLL